MKPSMQFLYLFLTLHSSALYAYLTDCLEKEFASEIKFSRATFFEIKPDTSIQSLSEIYIHLQEVTNNKLVKNLEAKRLINQMDWKKVKSQKDAWRTYGDTTMQDWFKGREYILSLPKNQAIDSHLLKKIHKIVTKNHKFHGFEGRRLLQKLQKGKISRQEFDALKKRAFEKNEEVSGVSHSSLTGVFRQNPIDQLIHRGSGLKKDGTRYFTKNELEALRKNQYITVDEDSIKKVGKNAYLGTARYGDIDMIEESVKNILKNHAEQLKKSRSHRDVVGIVVSMEKDLVSIHPFLDGNGRTIRLLGDYILNKYNLPPSLYPNESDLTMSLNESIKFRIEGMRDYLKEHQQHIKDSIK